MKPLISILFFCLLVHSLTGQDYRTDFEKIRNGFNQKGKLISFDVTYRYYEHPSAKLCTDSMKGRFSMEGNRYRYELSGHQMVRGDQYYIVVNDLQQTLSIQKSGAAPAQYSLGLVDSLAKLNGVSVKTLSGNNKIRGYSLSGFKGEVKQVEIWFDVASYQVQKIILQYERQQSENRWLEPRVMVTYNNYRTGPAADVFSEKGFVSRVGNKWIPTDKYKNYRLIDHSMNPN